MKRFERCRSSVREGGTGRPGEGKGGLLETVTFDQDPAEIRSECVSIPRKGQWERAKWVCVWFKYPRERALKNADAQAAPHQ